MEYGKLIIENDEVKSIEIYDLEKFVLYDCEISDTTTSKPMPFFNEKGKYIGYEHKYSGDKKSINIKNKKYKDGYYFYVIKNYVKKTFEVYVVLKKQGYVLTAGHLEIILGISSYNKEIKDHSSKLKLDKETGQKYYNTFHSPYLDENFNISGVEHELDFDKLFCLDEYFVFQRDKLQEDVFFTFNEKHKELEKIINGRQPIHLMFVTDINADRFADFPFMDYSNLLGENYKTLEGEHGEDYIFIASYEDLTNRRNEHIQTLYYEIHDNNFKNGIDTYLEGFPAVFYSAENPNAIILEIYGGMAIFIFEGFDMSRLVYKKFKSFAKLVDRRFGEDEDLYDLSERRIKNFLKKAFE